jgi:hypothetical protein
VLFPPYDPPLLLITVHLEDSVLALDVAKEGIDFDRALRKPWNLSWCAHSILTSKRQLPANELKQPWYHLMYHWVLSFPHRVLHGTVQHGPVFPATCFLGRLVLRAEGAEEVKAAT